MGKKCWKANIIISMIMFALLLAIGTTLLVLASKGTPNEEWLDGEGKRRTIVAFELSTTYVLGGAILSLSFLFLGFLFINYFIRKSMIKSIGKEKAAGEITTDLKKYGFLLAHVLPNTRKQKKILEGLSF